MLEQFSGLPYQWQQFDCLGLVNAVRSNYGGRLLDEFDWIYKRWTEAEFPIFAVTECLNGYATRREGMPQHLDLIEIHSEKSGTALGSLVIEGSERYAVFMGLTHSVVMPADRISRLIRGYWDY